MHPVLRRILSIGVLLSLVFAPAPPVKAQSAGSCADLGALVPMDFEVITVSSAAIGFTTSKIATSTATAKVAVWYLAANAVNYREDGTNPTAGVGMPVAAGTYGTTCGQKAVSQIRFIRQSADATLSVSYYRGE